MPDEAPAKDARLSRRLLLIRSLAGASSTALLAATSAPARAQRSGITDTDPDDPEGNGRGGGERPAGVTDTDPSDPPGRGRGGPSQGVTDRDPSDPPGRGRGNRRRAIDADPTD